MSKNRGMKSKKVCGIYKLVIGKYYYIGASLNCFHRFRAHWSRIRHGSSSPKIMKAYNEYGWIRIEILQECSEDQLSAVEMNILSTCMKDELCLNTRFGTGGAGRRSSETRKLLSTKAKSRKWSDQTKEAISRGQVESWNWRRKYETEQFLFSRI